MAWTIDAERSRSRLGWPQLLMINDLEAMAMAIPLLSGEGLKPLNGVAPDEKGPIAVIAAGTGLGEAFLTWRGDRYTVHAGEGGHGDFAPTDPFQLEVLTFLMEKFGHATIAAKHWC